MRFVGKKRRTLFRCGVVVVYIALPFIKDFADEPLEFLIVANVIFALQVCFTLAAFLPKRAECDKKKNDDGGDHSGDAIKLINHAETINSTKSAMHEGKMQE